MYLLTEICYKKNFSHDMIFFSSWKYINIQKKWNLTKKNENQTKKNPVKNFPMFFGIYSSIFIFTQKTYIIMTHHHFMMSKNHDPKMGILRKNDPKMTLKWESTFKKKKENLKNDMMIVHELCINFFLNYIFYWGYKNVIRSLKSHAESEIFGLM